MIWIVKGQESKKLKAIKEKTEKTIRVTDISLEIRTLQRNKSNINNDSLYQLP